MYLLQGDMFSEYDKIGIKPKFFIKYIIKLKEPIPHSAYFSGMTQYYIVGHRSSLETLIRKCKCSI